MKGSRLGKRTYSLMRWIAEIEAGAKSIYLGRRFVCMSRKEFDRLRRKK